MDPEQHVDDDTTPLQEVKYSLRQMLAEVEQERAGSTLGREMVDQDEITRFFKRRKGRIDGDDKQAP